MTSLVYKLFRAAEWADFQGTRAFSGSPDDLRDGFIHLSAAPQVRATFDKYFSKEHNPILASIDSAALGEALKWEVSRGGVKFPHFYGVLKPAQVLTVFEIRKDAGGRPIFPPEIP